MNFPNSEVRQTFEKLLAEDPFGLLVLANELDDGWAIFDHESRAKILDGLRGRLFGEETKGLQLVDIRPISDQHLAE